MDSPELSLDSPELIVDSPELADQPEPSQKPMRHAAKVAGASRARKSRISAPAAPRALGRPFDDRPVFVSAKVLSLRAPANGNGTGASADASAPPEKAAAEVLTAEALSHRWISNPSLH